MKIIVVSTIVITVLRDWDEYFEGLVKSWIEQKKKSGKPFKHKEILITGQPFQDSAITFIDNEEESSLTLSFYPALRRGFGKLEESEVKELIELL